MPPTLFLKSEGHSAASLDHKIDLSMPVHIASVQGIDVTDPLYTDSEALIVKKSDNRQYTSWEDLKGETIVTFKGTPLADLFQKSGLFKEVRLVTAGAEVVQAVREPVVKAGFKGVMCRVRHRNCIILMM